MFMELTRDSFATFSQGSGNVAKHKRKKKETKKEREKSVHVKQPRFSKHFSSAEGDQDLSSLKP